MVNRGYIQSWNAIVERRLPGDFVATVGYVGTATVHHLADLDINAAPVDGGNTGRPLYAQFGRTAATSMWGGFLSSNYHSLQTSVSRSMKGGLLVRGAYTFSKAINSTDEDGWASLMWNHAQVLDRNRALAGYDRTHVLQLAAVYELPFGPGKPWATSGFVSQLVRDWQINGTFSAYTGNPFSVTASGASLNAPGNNQTADQVKSDVEKLGGIGRDTPFYDPTAFRAVGEKRYGSTGRNILRAPGVINTDLAAFRTFRLTERFALQLRAEAFNATNTPHFNAPSSNASAANFLAVTSAATDERVFRFALRLTF